MIQIIITIIRPRVQSSGMECDKMVMLDNHVIGGLELEKKHLYNFEHKKEEDRSKWKVRSHTSKRSIF